MYVKRGMKEIVCLKMEMGLREEEKREFDEFMLLCLRVDRDTHKQFLI